MRTPFVSIDAAQIRLAAPADTPLPWPDLTGQSPQDVASWREWLTRVRAKHPLIEAIEVAGPHLPTRINDVCDGRLTQPRRVRRVVESVMRYLLRRHTRATPFGLFAGVAPVRLGSRTAVGVGRESAVARPDATWLASLITGLERDPHLLARSSVVADNRAHARGDRWVLPWHSDPAGGQRPGIGEVSVRRTRAVQLTVEAARSPITVYALTDHLSAELPGTSRKAITELLTTLVAHQILITDLHPPMEATDPVAHLLTRLREAAPHGRGGEHTAGLETLHELLASYSRQTAPKRRRAQHARIIGRMEALHPAPRPRIAVDLRADTEVTLPRAVTHEAERAATALAALAPHPAGSPAWRSWHTRFLERYGEGAIVPLGEVTDPVAGLGLPAGYRGTAATPPAPALGERDRALMRLAQRAALDPTREVVLEEPQLHALAQACGPEPATGLAPHTELRFSVHAPTTTAIDEGAFELSVIGASRQAGTLTGRFLDLLEQPDRARMQTALAEAPALAPGAIRAQLSCPPLAVRTHDVARAPAVLPRIVLGQHPGHDTDRTDICLRDLAVTGDHQGLRLMSLSRGLPVEPTCFNAVAARRAAHPLARFLYEVSTARTTGCRTFDWGAAEDLPFLPRLRYRRAVLVPARWNLTTTDLPGPRAPWPQWHRAWQDLHQRLRMPEGVLLGEDDRFLRLDTAEASHLALLRRTLETTGRARLTEAPPVGAHGWIGERAHEIVLPMSAPGPASQAAPRPRPTRPVRHHGHHPGSAWLYARLHTHPDRYDTILTGHLNTLPQQWSEDQPGALWFVRSRTPEPHMRLRMRLRGPDHYGTAAQQLGTWADSLRDQGLLNTITLDTYYPEVARFGTGPVLAAAEAFFAADSTAVLAQLAATQGGWRTQALTAASMVDLAEAFTGDLRQGCRWLVEHPPNRPAEPPPRQIREQVLALTDHGPSSLSVHPGGEALEQAWQQRRSAATAYRSLLEDRAPDAPDVDRVLADLLHLHHNRMVGPDRESERGCLRLARAAAITLAARPQRREPSPQ